MEHDTFAHLIEVKQNWQFACCESSFCFHAQVNALWFIYWKKINTISTNKRLNWEARESRWGKGCAEESLWVLYREVPQKLGGFSVLFQPGGVHSHAEEDLKDNLTDPGARGHGMGLTWLLSSPAVGFCPVQGDAIYLVLQVVKAQSWTD